MMTSFQAVTTRRNKIANGLVDELSKRGFLSKIDGVMGSCYIDLEGCKGFFVELNREHTKADRPFPDNFDYTGRIVVVYQGFGQGTATEITEPEGGFDLEHVTAEIVREVRESNERRIAWEAKKAKAQKDAASLEVAILDEFSEGMDSDPSVHVSVAQNRDGEWVPRIEVGISGLDEAQARAILGFARTLKATGTGRTA